MNLRALAILALFVAPLLLSFAPLAYATQGSPCALPTDCTDDTGDEICYQGSCRITCQTDDARCEGTAVDSTCRMPTGSSVKVCMPELGGSTQSDPTCGGTCTGTQTCTYVQSADTYACASPTTSTTATPGSGTFKNPLKAGDLSELLTAVLHGVVQVGALLLVLALVWVGFLFVSAQGAEEKIRDARNALFWTIVGGLILLGATAISEVIGSTIEAL